MEAFQEWCYFPDELTYHLLSLHILGSYFFELYNSYPYLNLNGHLARAKRRRER